MTVADSSEIDAALATILVNDATLAALMPDGVYFDVAKHGAQKFIILSLVVGLDTRMLGGRAYEVATYLVKAVALASTGADVKAAAARIDALLSADSLGGGSVSFTATGFDVMAIDRVERVRYTEVDEDTDARWQHRGGHYEVWCSPTT